MTTDREILEQYRVELEEWIKYLFIWTMGESAITEMTRSARDKIQTRWNKPIIFTIQTTFYAERNKFHSRADFFGIAREKNETAEDVWTRILRVKKNCQFENVTPAELIASKNLSLIGRSTGDYELKKKIRKRDMTIEAITDLIHENMYDRLNESKNSNDGRGIQHIQERQYKRKWSDKSEYERPRKKLDSQKPHHKDNRCGQCGAPNWSRMNTCPAKSAESGNYKRRGHYEKMCRSIKKTQHIERQSSSAEEDNWVYNKMQKVNGNDQKVFYNKTFLVNGRPSKFIIDSGSPVTLIPNCLFIKTTEVEPLVITYRDVNKHRIEFIGQREALVKTNNKTIKLPLLITKQITSPLLGLVWMKRLGIHLITVNIEMQ